MCGHGIDADGPQCSSPPRPQEHDAADDDQHMSDLSDLLAQFRDTLHRYAHTKIGAFGIAGRLSAEDAVSEAITRALARWSRSSSEFPTAPEQIFAWLMRATLFICLEEARRKVPEAWSAEDLEAAMARYEFALLGEGTGTVAITVDEFLASLDELDRRVLQLTLATPFKSGDIAERVGLSAQA